MPIISLAAKQKKSDRPFVAIDGETVNNNYCLLGTSLTGASLTCEPSHYLKTRDCLDFLWRLQGRKAVKDRGPIFVWFAGHFDVNHIVRDLSPEAKDHFFNGGQVELKKYRLQYIHRKWFSIRKLESKHAVRIYDVWGFFQSSFIKACEKFLPEQWKKHQDLIEWGKAERGEFEAQDLEQVINYNHSECLLLVELMNHIRDVLEKGDIFLSRGWHGPSGVASYLLRKHGIKSEFPNEEYMNEIPGLEDAHLRAYFGGRIEAVKLGTFKDVFYYDINSAYPTALAKVSRIGEDSWIWCDRFIDGFPCSLWRLRWKIKGYIGPLPFRVSNGSIYFPAQGEGWYWSPEVKFLLDFYPGSVEIIGGFCHRERPAQFRKLIPRWYKRRLALKQKNDKAELALKLALNSLYGKLAQRQGYAAYRNLSWAGFVTSHCRAMLMRAIAGQEEKVVCFSTDGIITTEPLKGLEFSKALGGWSLERWKRATVVMPGLYYLENGQEIRTRIRGFKGIDWDMVLSDLTEKGQSNVRQNLFITHKLARAMPEAFGKDYLSFVERDRILRPYELDKRHYHMRKIRDWRKDFCDSTILQSAGAFSEPIGAFDDTIENEIYYEEDLS